MRLKALARHIAAAQNSGRKKWYEVVWALLPIVISLGALGVSAIAFYRSNFYVNNALELRLFGGGFMQRLGTPGDENGPPFFFHEKDQQEYAVTAILVNAGNRDALVLNAQLFIPDDSGITAFGKENAVAPFSMKAGEIKVVTLPFTLGQVRAHRNFRLTLRVETVDSYGRHASKYINPAAFVKTAGDGSFWLAVQDTSLRLIG